jgi:hypothetical protein
MFDLKIKREQGIILTMVELANFDVWNQHLVQNFVEQCHIHRLLDIPNMSNIDKYYKYTNIYASILEFLLTMSTT